MGGRAKGARVLSLVEDGWSDEKIVAGLARSDPDAARALYDRYGDLVNRLIWRLLGADGEHDDVVHQAFVNILTSIHKVENPSALPGWIRSVCVNTVRREIRSRKYRRILSLVPEQPEVEAAGDEHLARAFYSILSSVDADDRIAFVLHHVEGQSLPEAAETVGCSLATVKRRIARARKIVMDEVQRSASLSSLVEDMKND